MFNSARVCNMSALRKLKVKHQEKTKTHYPGILWYPEPDRTCDVTMIMSWFSFPPLVANKHEILP